MKLATYLKDRGMKRKDFAAAIGCAPSCVSEWIKTDRFPRPRYLERIAKATGGEVTANDFMPDRDTAA